MAGRAWCLVPAGLLVCGVVVATAPSPDRPGATTLPEIPPTPVPWPPGATVPALSGSEAGR